MEVYTRTLVYIRNSLGGWSRDVNVSGQRISDRSFPDDTTFWAESEGAEKWERWLVNGQIKQVDYGN